MLRLRNSRRCSMLAVFSDLVFTKQNKKSHHARGARTKMKIGFNLLLWTINVEDKHMPILEDLKKTGYDGVEVPVFGGDPAQFKALGQRLSDMGLERTAVSALTSTEVNPLADDAVIRGNAVDFMR